MSLIGRFTAHTYAIMRIIVGLLFATHGAQKLFGFPPADAPMPSPLPPMLLVSGVIELVCGLAVAIGLFAGVFAFIASGEMAAAYFMVHAPHGFWPLVNKGELAVAYCFLFLYMSAHGSGIWSVDALLQRRRPGAAPVTA